MLSSFIVSYSRRAIPVLVTLSWSRILENLNIKYSFLKRYHMFLIFNSFSFGKFCEKVVQFIQITNYIVAEGETFGRTHIDKAGGTTKANEQGRADM